MGTVDSVVIGLAAATIVWAVLLAVVCHVVWREPPASRPRRGMAIGPPDVRAGLAASRRRLATLLGEVLRGPHREIFAGLEEALVAADVGVETSRWLLARVQGRLGMSADAIEVQRALRGEMLAAFAPRSAVPLARPGPHVVLVTGVNGVGKTTTVGKLAARYQKDGERVLLVAADTFRAAAIEQLQTWGRRLGLPVIAGAEGSSPAAAVFDGMRAASATGVDVVLIDTAGRLHTRKPLVEELRKVRRVIAEGVAGAPHETLLILDATTGQNALSQARAFTEAVAVTGVVLTKLDGTARGGMALAVTRDLGLPIRDIGVGEGVADLRPFSPEEFVAGLLDVDGPAAVS